MTIRGLGLAGGVVGGGLMLAVANGPDSDLKVGAAATVLGLSAVTYVGGMVYDVVHAPTVAREANAHHLALAPTMVGASSDRQLGVGLSGTF
jgi:hypothetical protein